MTIKDLLRKNPRAIQIFFWTKYILYSRSFLRRMRKKALVNKIMSCMNTSNFVYIQESSWCILFENRKLNGKLDTWKETLVL